MKSQTQHLVDRPNHNTYTHCVVGRPNHRFHTEKRVVIQSNYEFRARWQKMSIKAIDDDVHEIRWTYSEAGNSDGEWTATAGRK